MEGCPIKKIIAVTSGKGGTGKSTAATGLGLALATRGKSVLLVDLDAGLRCLDLMLGIDGSIVFDLGDVLNGTPLGDAVYPVPSCDGLSVLPAPAKNGVYNPDIFCTLMQALEKCYDWIILDFPAGLDFRLLAPLGAQTQVLVICNADAVSVRDAAAVYSHLPETVSDAWLVPNRFSAKEIQSGAVRNLDDMVDASGFRLGGIIPQTTELARLCGTHCLNKNKRSFKAFYRLSGRLSGEWIELPKFKKI